MVTKSRRIFEPYRRAVPCRGGRQRRRMIAASPTLRPPDARLSDRYHAGDRQDRHETGQGVRGITLPQQEALKTASVALWSLSGIAPGARSRADVRRLQRHPERPDRRRRPHRRCPEAHPTTCCLPSLPSCAIPREMLTRLVERVWWNGSAPSVPRKLARFPVVSSEFQLILFGD